MEVVLIIMAAFALLGLVDDFIGGKLGVAEDFQNGLITMGRMVICYSGFYCVGITLVEKAAEPIARLGQVLPFDPSVLIACFVSSDCGALPIAQAMAASPEIGVFNGALLASTLGCSMGYQFPYYLSALNKQHIPMYVQGAAFGLVTVPVGLIAGGIAMKMPAAQIISNIMPVLLLCILMVVGLLLCMERTLKILLMITRFILLMTYCLFAAVLISLFLPGLNITDIELVKEIGVVALRTMIVTCGGLVLANLLTRYCRAQVAFVGKLLKINEQAVMGLVLSLFNGIAMLPLLGKMDRRGRLINVAFSVSAAYCLGGQMAFVSALIPKACMPAFMINKLVAGIAAIILVDCVMRLNRDKLVASEDI